MRTQSKVTDENRIAEEIVSVLPPGVARACSPEKNSIRYTIRVEGLKLRTIVFSRESLRRLLDDPQSAVKVEYLKRDLLDSATKRTAFQYPRIHFHVTPSLPRRLAFNLPLASMG
jgi:hypothetical protein